MDLLPEAFERAFRAARHAGRLERPTATGRAENAACGDVVEFDVFLEEGRIAQVRFRAAGRLSGRAGGGGERAASALA